MKWKWVILGVGCPAAAISLAVMCDLLIKNPQRIRPDTSSAEGRRLPSGDRGGAPERDSSSQGVGLAATSIEGSAVPAPSRQDATQEEKDAMVKAGMQFIDKMHFLERRGLDKSCLFPWWFERSPGKAGFDWLYAHAPFGPRPNAPREEVTEGMVVAMDRKTRKYVFVSVMHDRIVLNTPRPATLSSVTAQEQAWSFVKILRPDLDPSTFRISECGYQPYDRGSLIPYDLWNVKWNQIHRGTRVIGGFAHVWFNEQVGIEDVTVIDQDVTGLGSFSATITEENVRSHWAPAHAEWLGSESSFSKGLLKGVRLESIRVIEPVFARDYAAWEGENILTPLPPLRSAAFRPAWRADCVLTTDAGKQTEVEFIIDGATGDRIGGRMTLGHK